MAGKGRILRASAIILLLLLGTSLAFIMDPARAGCATPIRDQYCHAEFTGEYWAVGIGLDSGQEFKPSLETLAYVCVLLYNSEYAEVTLLIRKGTISGEIIASHYEEFPACPPPPEDEPPLFYDRCFDFADVLVVPDETYVIQLTGTGGVLWWQSAYANTYERGRPIFGYTPWELGHDLAFETWGYGRAATVSSVWTTNVEGDPKVKFDPGEFVCVHWKADGVVNVTVHDPDGIIERDWACMPGSGVNFFVPSQINCRYEIRCTGAEAKIIAIGSIFIIPGIPFYGSLLALAAMISAFFIMRKRRNKIANR